MDLDDAGHLATDLLAQHGLTGWTLVFDNAKARFGQCRYERRQISLSRRLTALSSVDEVQETLLHEIAHALVGEEHGHNEVWRRTAQRIGASGAMVGERLPGAEGAWEGRCPEGHVRYRHKRPERVSTCPDCSSAFDPAHLLEWTYRGRPAPMHPAYLAELASIQDRAGLPRTGLTAEVEAVAPLSVGSTVVTTGSDAYAGLTGVVQRRARTRYHLRTARGRLTVPVNRVAPRQDEEVGE